jgi:hypothetical protein
MAVTGSRPRTIDSCVITTASIPATRNCDKDNNSYATLVPEGEGTARLAEDPDSLETPNADKRDDETKQRLHDPGSSDTRDVDAGAIADENAEGSPSSGSGEGDDEGDTTPHHHDDGSNRDDADHADAKRSD